MHCHYIINFAMFLFLSSEFLVHLDFYTAIVLPFWHEEKVASNENAATFICVLSIIGSAGAAGSLFFSGYSQCINGYHPCPIVPILNLSLDQSTSMMVLAMTSSLLAFVFLTCCHVFLIALQKLRANVVVAPAAANNLSSGNSNNRLVMVTEKDEFIYEDTEVVTAVSPKKIRKPFEFKGTYSFMSKNNESSTADVSCEFSR